MNCDNGSANFTYHVQPDHTGQIFGHPGDGIRLQPISSIGIRLPVTTVTQLDGARMQVETGDGNIKIISMTDFGMILHSSGAWNHANWMVMV